MGKCNTFLESLLLLLLLYLICKKIESIYFKLCSKSWCSFRTIIQIFCLPEWIKHADNKAPGLGSMIPGFRINLGFQPLPHYKKKICLYTCNNVSVKNLLETSKQSEKKIFDRFIIPFPNSYISQKKINVAIQLSTNSSFMLFSLQPSGIVIYRTTLSIKDCSPRMIFLSCVFHIV